MQEFDGYADRYDEELNRGISISGERKEFFAEARIERLSQCLAELNTRPSKLVLDFGCGTGASTPYLHQILNAERIIGIDVSQESLRVARATQNTTPADFYSQEEYAANGNVDVVFSNGVFHHIPPSERGDAMSYIANCLRPGGLFALWENNPWNLGTRYVMSKIPFDRDAIMLSASTASKLVRSAGLNVVRIDYHFIFPKPLRFLRSIEPYLKGVPIGAQYQLLCRKES